MSYSNYKGDGSASRREIIFNGVVCPVMMMFFIYCIIMTVYYGMYVKKKHA